jgi:hypothetical protein
LGERLLCGVLIPVRAPERAPAIELAQRHKEDSWTPVVDRTIHFDNEARAATVAAFGLTLRSPVEGQPLQNLQKATLDRLNILAGILLIGLGAVLCARIV